MKEDSCLPIRGHGSPKHVIKVDLHLLVCDCSSLQHVRLTLARQTHLSMSDLPQHVTHLSTSLTSVCCLSTSLTSAHQTYLGMSDSPQRISFTSACQTHLCSMSDSPPQHVRLTSAAHQTHLSTSDSPQHITHLSTPDLPQHITHLSTSDLPQYVRLTSVHHSPQYTTHLSMSDSPQHVRLTSAHQTHTSARQDSPQHVMKGDLPAGVQLLNLIAHVLEEQAALLGVHLQASLQQA